MEREKQEIRKANNGEMEKYNKKRENKRIERA